MSGINERKIMVRGLIAEKREEMSKLSAVIERAQRDILQYTASYLTVDELRIDLAKSAFEELETAVSEYRAAQEEIHKLEKEL